VFTFWIPSNTFDERIISGLPPTEGSSPTVLVEFAHCSMKS
jgi:hypothetical protein